MKTILKKGIILLLLVFQLFITAPIAFGMSGSERTLSRENRGRTEQAFVTARAAADGLPKSTSDATAEPNGRIINSRLRSSPKTGSKTDEKNNKASGGKIISAVAGNGFTAGLRDDGTIVYAGDHDAVRKALSGWNSIERIELTKGQTPYIIGYGRDGSISLVSTFTDWDQFSYLVQWKDADFAAWKNVKKLYVGGKFSVGLCGDGSVLFKAKDEKAQAEYAELKKTVTAWKNVQDLYVDWHPLIVALKTDGTIVTNDPETLTGKYNYLGGQWTGPETWNNVDHLVDCSDAPYAIKTDGTVLGIDLPGWTMIRSVYFGSQAMYGLRQDGTVATFFHGGISTSSKVQEVSAWRNIVQLGMDMNAYARDIPVGLCADGTVKAVTYDSDNNQPFGEWDVSGWSGVKRIYSGSYYTIGIKSDGTVLATGGERGTAAFVSEVSGWQDIEQFAFSDVEYISDIHVVGIRGDGTILAAGCNNHGQCDVESFHSA